MKKEIISQNAQTANITSLYLKDFQFNILYVKSIRIFTSN